MRGMPCSDSTKLLTRACTAARGYVTKNFCAHLLFLRTQALSLLSSQKLLPKFASMIAHMKLALLLALFVAIIAVFGVDADRYDDCRGGWQVPGAGSLI